MENVKNLIWYKKEITEINRMSLKPEIKQALKINAALELARKAGANYNDLKEEIIKKKII